MDDEKVQDCGNGGGTQYDGPFTYDPRILYILSRIGVGTTYDLLRLPARVVWKMYVTHTDVVDELGRDYSRKVW